MLRFYRNDGSTSPATAEYVELFDDGRFAGWRSIASAVGWFGGELAASESDDVRALIAGLGGEVPGPPPPGPTTETLELPDRDPLVVTGVDGTDRSVPSSTARGTCSTRWSDPHVRPWRWSPAPHPGSSTAAPIRWSST